MMPDPDDAPRGPYEAAAWLYWRAGWKGVLPMPPTKKWPPPNGFTGYEGVWPDAGWIQRWNDERPDGNLALRLPREMVGVDVDDYDNKAGGRTLAEAEARLGPLPPTVMSTSRSGGVSGVRLFRCRPQDGWPSVVGPDIEVISFGHRYVVAWPSIHPEGGTYRWVDQRTGEVLDGPPDPATLPELPAAWVEHLQQRRSTHAVKGQVSDPKVRAWLGGLRPGDPCDKVSAALAAPADGSRHEAMLAKVGSLVGLGAWGHAGVAQALTEVHGWFIKAAMSDGSRDAESAAGEWRRSLSGAVGMFIVDHPAPADGCVCQVTTITEKVEEDFWASRPVLEHIRQFARSRMASPWGVLGVVLTRAAVAMPPHYVLPAVIGGHASLNLFVALCANSGGGKGASESAGRDAVDVGDIRSSGVGSGEGILHQYVVRKKATPELPGGIEQHTKAVLFTASEVDTLGALHSRNSSTLLSELRKVWMGEELSFAYVDPTKRLTVARHAYRAGLVVGVQPARAAVLLEDADGGTPQRFVWLPAYDRDMPDVTPEQPDPWSWEMPRDTSMRVDGRVVLEVCQEAVDTIREEHRKRNRGEGDALDGHALLCRLKVAAGFAVLDSRLDVSSDDWSLAGVVMEKSDETRGNVVTVLREERRQQNRAKGLADAERGEVVEEASTTRVARLLSRRLAGGDLLPRGGLRKALTSRDRGYFDAAIEGLVSAGVVSQEDDGRSSAYRWVGGGQ